MMHTFPTVAKAWISAATVARPVFPVRTIKVDLSSLATKLNLNVFEGDI